MTDDTISANAPAEPRPPPLPPSEDAIAVASAFEPRVSSKPLIVAAVLSCGLHAAAAAAILLAPVSIQDYGVRVAESDAISVEMMQTTVLEALEEVPVSQSAAAASTAQQLGQQDDTDTELHPMKGSDEVDRQQPVPETIAATEVPEIAATEPPLNVVRGSGAPAQLLRAKTAKDNKKVREKVDRKSPVADETKYKKRTKARKKGGKVARSSTRGASSSARVSASRGSILNYMARVRSRVARNKPAGRGHRGTAHVSFGVSRSGGLAYARLSRSSGNRALDRAAVAAVRRAAPFGRPPPGVPASRLRFNIPFYFR